MYNTNNSSPMVTNCTFSGNTASPPIGGGGMYNGGGSPTVTNCILWGDRPDEISNNTSSPTVSFSDVQGGYTGTGNIDADPLFVDANGADNTVGTDDDDLRLSAGSPCIDAADNSIVAIYRALDPSTPETACATLQEIGCSEDESGCGAGFNSDVCVTGLAPGEMYYIQLAARTDEDRGVYRLDIESPCPGVPPDCPLG